MYIHCIYTYTHIRRALVQCRGWGNGAFFSCWVHLEYSPSEDRRKSTALPLSHAIAGRISKTCRFTLGHVEIWASSLVLWKIHQFYIINSLSITSTHRKPKNNTNQQELYVTLQVRKICKFHVLGLSYNILIIKESTADFKGINNNCIKKHQHHQQQQQQTKPIFTRSNWCSASEAITQEVDYLTDSNYMEIYLAAVSQI